MDDSKQAQPINLAMIPTAPARGGPSCEGDTGRDTLAIEDMKEDADMYDDDLDEVASCQYQESAPQARRPTGRIAETKKLVFLSKTVLELVR